MSRPSAQAIASGLGCPQGADPASCFDLKRLRRSGLVRSVVYEPVLPSTNNRALELAETTTELPLLVLTGHQTAGRGRGSHRWWSAPGALTFSLVVDPDAFDLPACLWPQVALTAALSVLEFVSRVVPGSPVGLRWPNDVHLGGKKICGTLVEPVVIQGLRVKGEGSGARIGKADSKRVRGAQRGATSTKRKESALRIPNSAVIRSPTRLVIGVGVNLNNSLRNAPPEVQRTGTSLADRTGDRYDPTATLLGIMDALKQRLDWLAVGDSRLSEAWQKHCLLRGRIVTIDAGPNVVAGRCLGIDQRGALRIETGNGVEALYGGAIRSAT